MSSCNLKKTDTKTGTTKQVLFSGSVFSTEGKAIKDPIVEINGKTIQNIESGNFRGMVDSAGRYVVNVRKNG